MNLAVVGLGMVSPLGRTPADHAFLVRAEVGAASPGGFVGGDGDVLHVAYCPWLGAGMPISERLAALGWHALQSALTPWFAATHGTARDIPVLVVGAMPRPGLAERDLRALDDGARAFTGSRRMMRRYGEVATFAGLTDAATLLADGAPAVAVLAADSFVSTTGVAAFQRSAETPWDRNLPRPSEGSAALLVTTPAAAKRANVRVLATIEHTATAMGAAHDDNDLAVDGIAMTALLRGAPSTTIQASFGQHGVGALRRREWDMAIARCASRFAATCPLLCLEDDVGCVGAAAGALHLAHGIAVSQLDAWPGDSPSPGPLLAWAVSRDGTRGVCVATVSPASDASQQRGTRHRPELVRVTPTPAPAADEPGSRRTVAEMSALEIAGLLQASAMPEVSLDIGRGEPHPAASFYGEVRAGCLERLAMLGRHRSIRPLGERVDIEARLLAQVDALATAGCTAAALLDFWEWADRDDPWMLWATLTVLALLPGTEGLAAVPPLLEALHDGEGEAVVLAAEALLLSPHPGVAGLVRDLLRSPSAAARAAAIEIASRRGGLRDADAAASLSDDSPLVLAAAIRALSRSEMAGDRLPAEIGRLTSHRDAQVAWEASRALTLVSDRGPYLEVREGGPLAGKLGVRALDLFVMAGDASDVQVVERMAGRLAPSGEVLDAVARFGQRELAGFLVRHLAERELAEDAARALVTLLGPKVQDTEWLSAAAWLEAIARAPEMAKRLRCGRPWSPTTVVDECRSGALARPAVERRLDELRARTRKRRTADLAMWGLPDLHEVRA